MIDIKNIPLNKEVYCFELEDVLFPKEEYVFQVYYLFASFIEFTEGSPAANEMAVFMKTVYLNQGEDAVFDLAQETFGFDPKYRENLGRLFVNAQLPLKLALYEEMVDFLLDLFEKGKKIVVLTKGNPIEQLNKLKHIDWDKIQKLKDLLKVYFVDELLFRNIVPISYIAEEFNIAEEQIQLVQV